MGVNFTPQDSSALYRLLADETADIVLKTDCEGFVVHASSAIGRLGILPEMLIGPHILDLVHPDSASAVAAQHAAAIAGRQGGPAVEFRALSHDRRGGWFEMRMRRLADDRGETYGVLGLMRSIEERRRYEDRLFAASLTDPLTGLTNRPAFISMLGHLVDQGIGGCLALFDIDHLKAINRNYGQSVGDEVLVVFADFLRSLVRAEDIISRIGGESLGVLLPRATPAEAEAVCARIVATLTEIRRSAGPRNLTITASAGAARIAGSLDETIQRAELALFFAKAKGRNRLEMDKGVRAA